MSTSHAFDHRVRPNGEVHIFQQGRMVKLVRGEDAKTLLAALDKGDVQSLLADAVGGSGPALPKGAVAGGAAHLHGNGAAHTQQQFRRKSG